MACIITYENKQYTQKEFEQYFKEHFTEFVDNFLGSKQDIEGFKEFASNTKSRKDVDNNREVNNLNFNTLDSETLKALKDKEWTEKMWNSVSQIEREQAIKCISF